MSRFCSCALVFAVLAPLAAAQPQGEPPRQGPGGPGRGDPGAFIDRIMEADSNGDGKISKEEAEANPFLARIMERADSNGDGALDRAEVEAFAASRRGGPPPGAAAPEGEEGEPASFEDHMEHAGGALRRLSRAELTEPNLAANLETITQLQAALIGAKAMAKQAELRDEAKERYGDRVYVEVMRWFNKALRASLDAEDAMLAGQDEAVKSHLAKLTEVRNQAHEMFKD